MHEITGGKILSRFATESDLPANGLSVYRRSAECMTAVAGGDALHRLLDIVAAAKDFGPSQTSQLSPVWRTYGRPLEG